MATLATPDLGSSSSDFRAEFDELHREIEELRRFMRAEQRRIVKWVVGVNLLMAAVTWATMIVALLKGYV